MHDIGGMPMPLAALATVLFCAYLALFPALVGALWVRLRRRVGWQDVLLGGALWTAFELARGWLLTGFPWLSIGYSQVPPSPLAGYAPLAGVFGVGFLVALCAAALALAPWRRASPAAAIGLVVAVMAGGIALRDEAWTQPSGEPLTVSATKPGG